MAEENQETLNDQVPGSSPENDSSGSLQSTAEYTEEETSEETEEQSEETGEEQQKEEEERFDKHPRFQQLIEQKNKYKKMVEDLQGKKPVEQSTESADKKDKDELDNLLSKNDDELLELQAERPKEFLNMMTEAIRDQVRQEVRQEQDTREQENKTLSTYEEYAEKNPDILDMWENGDLQAFLDENPAHNPISAHMYLTQEKRESELREQVEKELAEKYEKRQSARENSRVLSRTPAADYKPEPDPSLKNTKEHGGLASVLTSRLEAMRQNR